MTKSAFCGRPAHGGTWHPTKALFFRRLTVFLLTLVFIGLSHRGPAQQVTLSAKNMTLKEVLKEVKRQTGYFVICPDAALASSKPVTIEAKNEPLTKFLEMVFKGQSLKYSIIGKKTINVFPAPADRQSGTAPDGLQGSTSPAGAMITVVGCVVSTDGKPLEGASVRLKGSAGGTPTDANGAFRIGANTGDILVISYTGYESREIAAENDLGVIKLRLSNRALDEVNVTVNTGYQKVSPELSTGSFNVVNNSLLNRSVSSNILDRIENLTPGVLFDHNPGAPDKLLIRGLGSIYANTAPLIVVDNFPYDGNINNINPNDIETVTILKDAAAASIWGARAGNGVIVITTKQAKTLAPTVQFSASYSITPRPDLNNLNNIPSSDFIDLEKKLFDKGYYDGQLAQSDITHTAFTPVVELLVAKRAGTIDPSLADAKIEALKKNNVFDDISKYLYQVARTQRYSLSVSGNTPKVSYYVSGGYDQSLANAVGLSSSRITMLTKNSFRVLPKLEVQAEMRFVQSLDKSGNNPGYSIGSYYPYARLKDNSGNNLGINTKYRQHFIDTSALNPDLYYLGYSPLDDLSAAHGANSLRDYVLRTGIKYDLLPGMNAELSYQYENSSGINRTQYDEQSFLVRDLVDSYYQPDADNKFPVPKGGILDLRTNDILSHQGRAQFNFDRSWTKHTVSAIAGYEVKQYRGTNSSSRNYGYLPDKAQVYLQMDYATDFQSYINKSSTSKIPGQVAVGGKTDRFISSFANASYTYDRRYTAFASYREDATNLFGVKTNQKGTPLWSVGTKWNINKESFYHITWLPLLEMKITYGYTGNISRLTSAFVTANYDLGTIYYPNLLVAEIQNPPNEQLRWERTRLINTAISFSALKGIISGTVEWYQKRGTDLLGLAPIDPTHGVITTIGSIVGGSGAYYANVAGMKGSGVEAQLNLWIIDRKNFSWQNTMLFSHSTSKVTEYLFPAGSNGSAYLSEANINPIVGKPVHALYSYRWGGLESASGDPQGFYAGKKSKDYSVLAAVPLDSMRYNGPMQPTYWGAFRNNFRYKDLSLSINFSYYFGFYFRKQSYYNEFPAYNADYLKRWKNPGDELKTNVPSFVYNDYPQFDNRERFYRFSEALVDKGDHIRLEDIVITYSVRPGSRPALPYKSAQFSISIIRPGLLWTANKDHVDPYAVGSPLQRGAFSMGANITF